MSTKQARGLITKLVARGVAIDPRTTDVREAVKREAWTRGLSLRALAERMGLDYDYVLKRIGEGQYSGAIHPKFLQQIIDALHITARPARRLHQLGAIEAGWLITPEEP